MENVGIALFHRTCLLAAIIMRLLILEICGDESLILIFHFLCKAIVSIYYSVYLPFLLSKKISSCSLCFIKFLILCTLRLMIVFLIFLFYLAVLHLLSVFLASNMSRIGSVFDVKGALSGLTKFLVIESPLKMMKNTYFSSKALFVLKIFTFLS